MKRPFIFALFFMALFGSLDNFRGLIIPKIQTDTGLSYSEVGLVFSAYNIGFLVSSLISGFTVDQIGIRRMFLLGIALMLAALFGFGLSSVFLMLYLFFLFSGLGAGAIEISMNSLVPGIYPEQQSKYFNMLHGFYGVGGIIGPVLVGWLVLLGVRWNELFLGIAVMMAFAWFIMIRTKFPPAKTVDTMDLRELIGLLRDPRFIVFNLVIMAYVASEVGLLTWLPVYLQEVRKAGLSTSASLVSLFFVSFAAETSDSISKQSSGI